jgi:hypothetical protein
MAGFERFSRSRRKSASGRTEPDDDRLRSTLNRPSSMHQVNGSFRGTTAVHNFEPVGNFSAGNRRVVERTAALTLK